MATRRISRKPVPAVKIYLATCGEYSDYQVLHVFARKEDAEAYVSAGRADRIEEFEIRYGPVEVRRWHMLTWRSDEPDFVGSGRRLGNPYMWSMTKDYDGDPRNITHQWNMPPSSEVPVLAVQGWDQQGVLKVFSEQRAQFLAGRLEQVPAQ